jgi:hypothetical protein
MPAQSATDAQSPSAQWTAIAARCLGIMTLVATVAVVIGLATPGYEDDIRQGKSWARQLVRNGIADAYRTDIDGAPVLLYAFAGAGALYQALFDPQWNERAAQESHTLTVLLKTPMVLAHVTITGLLYLLASSARSSLGWIPALVALAYGLNPATLYDAAHFGQTDPLVGLMAVLCLAGYYWRSAPLMGAACAALVLTKPQGWVLMPVIALATIMRFDVRTIVLAVVSGIVSTLLIVSPWIIARRTDHFWRYLDNLSGHDISNRVISADAHNLWWIPSLLKGDWIEDSAPLFGPVSYRLIALALTLLWLGLVLWSLRRNATDLALACAAASFGFFILMTRAHENHSYLALVLSMMAIASNVSPRQAVRIAAVISIGLLANLVLRDPLLMGPFTSVPDPGQPAPLWVVGLQIGNVVVFALALALLGRALAANNLSKLASASE